MYPYKITLTSKEVFNLSLLIQKINVTSKRIAYFYYNNTELQNYEGACLSRYMDNLVLFQSLETKLLNKLQHTEIYLLSFFILFQLSCITLNEKT